MGGQRRACQHGRLRPGDVQTLGQVSLLGALGEQALTELAIVCECWTLAKGEEVALDADGKVTTYFVVRGVIALSLESSSGKYLSVSTLVSGELFELDGMFRMGVDELVARAGVGPTLVCGVPREHLDPTVEACPEAVALRDDQMRRRLGEMAVIASDRLYPQSTRIRRALRRGADGSQDHSVRCTREQLAARSGTSRAKASEVISELVEQGVIEVDRATHRITVLDRDRLVPDL